MQEENVSIEAPPPDDVVHWKPGDTSFDQPALEAAPQVFRLAAVSSGVAALLYHHVQRNKLYESAGYDTMSEYAAAQLGVTKKSNQMKVSRAGRSAWENYRPVCMQILQAIKHRLTPVHPDFPALPSVTSLSLLPRALKNTPKRDHQALLTDVANGKRTDELERMAKAKVDDKAKAMRAETSQPQEVAEREQDDVPGYIRTALKFMADAEALFLRSDGAGPEGSESRQLVVGALETLTAACRISATRHRTTSTALPVIGRKGRPRRVSKRGRPAA